MCTRANPQRKWSWSCLGCGCLACAKLSPNTGVCQSGSPVAITCCRMNAVCWPRPCSSPVTRTACTNNNSWMTSQIYAAGSTNPPTPCCWPTAWPWRHKSAGPTLMYGAGSCSPACTCKRHWMTFSNGCTNKRSPAPAIMPTMACFTQPKRCSGLGISAACTRGRWHRPRLRPRPWEHGENAVLSCWSSPARSATPST
ncbi:hypothetical protein D3C78_993010 [compost metagenome]